LSDQVKSFNYEGEDGRLDKYLVSCLPEFSRNRIAGLIADGFVSVNGTAAKKSGQKIEAGDEIEVRIPPTQPTTLLAESIPLDVIFENDDLMIINKPAGMVVHPAPGHDQGTLVNAVLGHDPDIEGIGGEERPGIVHRLDKDTSGLIVVAKNERAHRWLTEQFKERLVEKTYLALVDGKPPTPVGRVEAPIGRDLKDRKKMAIVPLSKGREAVSEYKTLESFHKHTLLEFHPHTGRTHQIRLHCVMLGCPIVADTIYGNQKKSVQLKRHFLHAFQMKLILPGEKEARTFEAPLPVELESVLETLRNS